MFNVEGKMAISSFIFVLLMLVVAFKTCCNVIPPYIGNNLQNIHDRGELVEHYFKLGLNYSEILGFLLAIHGVTFCSRQLRRILKRRGLHRRGTHIDYRVVINAIELELQGSGNRIGYRQMHQRPRKDYRLIVDKETVRMVIKALDPESVQSRSSRRLRRREYRAKGPYYIWHIDGYNKHKPFGLCIHGAIDGYSRRIL